MRIDAGLSGFSDFAECRDSRDVQSDALSGRVHMAAAIRAGLSPVLRQHSRYVPTASSGGRIAALIADLPFMHRARKPGEYLFRAGDTFHSFYVLHAGFARTCYTSEDGREQTTGLHLRGDILGLDAVASGTHGSDAVALDFPLGQFLGHALLFLLRYALNVTGQEQCAQAQHYRTAKF